MLSLKDKILWFSFLSRVAILGLQVLLNAAVPDHDADAFLSPSDPKQKIRIADAVVEFLLGGLKRWDAQYFLHIAEYGYSHENCLAFFPLYPYVVKGIAELLFIILKAVLNYRSVILISAVLVNLFCFVKATSYLYDLSRKVLRDESLAYRAAILFCFNPSSIFFTAPYSEAMFALCTFYGMLKYHESKLYTPYFSLSCAIRSNGLLNMGFLVYQKLKLQTRVVEHLIILALELIVSVTPLAGFQFYAWYKFCVQKDIKEEDHLVDFGMADGWRMQGDPDIAWCLQPMPLSYTYIQSRYWEVGFLKYYHFKQIPNFLLAFPVVIIILTIGLKYILKNFAYCLHLGLKDYSSYKAKDSSSESGLFTKRTFVYVTHALVFVIFCVLCIHVQVTTRLIASASPVLYWFAAYLTTPDSQIPVLVQKDGESSAAWKVEKEEHLKSTVHNIVFSVPSHSLTSTLIKYYFLGYTLIGTAMFCNFYPWT